MSASGSAGLPVSDSNSLYMLSCWKGGGAGVRGKGGGRMTCIRPHY